MRNSRAESNASVAVRLALAGAQPHSDVRLFVNNQWSYRKLGSGQLAENAWENAKRLRTVQDAMSRAGLELDLVAAEASLSLDPDDLAGLRRFLDAHAAATAVLCMRSSIEPQLPARLRMMGIQIPQDLSFVGHGRQFRAVVAGATAGKDVGWKVIVSGTPAGSPGNSRRPGVGASVVVDPDAIAERNAKEFIPTTPAARPLWDIAASAINARISAPRSRTWSRCRWGVRPDTRADSGG